MTTLMHPSTRGEEHCNAAHFLTRSLVENIWNFEAIIFIPYTSAQALQLLLGQRLPHLYDVHVLENLATKTALLIKTVEKQRG